MTIPAQEILPAGEDKAVEKTRPVEKGRRPWQQPKEPIVRGAFIVVEGLDRAGKTTQVKNLADALYATGRNVMTMGFPDRSTDPIGLTIQRYLKEEIQMNDLSIHLLFSANRWEKAKDITDAVSSGYTVICDRYYYSGLVYGAAKDIPSLSMEWGRGPEVGLPRPDQVIFLNISPEQAAKRGGFGEERYEKEEFQKRIRKLFLQFPKLYTADEGKDFYVIDAGRSEEDVAKDVFKQVEEVVHHVETGKSYPLKHPNTGVQSFGKEIRKVNAWTEDWDTMQSLS